MKVWIVESGENETHHLDGVYSSESAAIAGVKAMFPAPYRVIWEEPAWNRYGELVVCGHFEDVYEYSIEHTGCFYITSCEVQD